jgi:hypothetical protein
MEAKTENESKLSTGLFINDIRVEDVREAVKGRTDFRECAFDDHIIFVYFLGMGKRNLIFNF